MQEEGGNSLIYHIVIAVLGLTFLIVSVVVFGIVFYAMTSQGTPTTQAMAEAQTTGTLVDIASSNDDFTTLVQAVVTAELAEALSGEGPFTVFAPTNEAFAATLEELNISAEDLLSRQLLLTDILLYHVVEGEVLAETVVTLDGESVPTLLAGSEISISIVDGGVVLNDSVNVVATDVMASNGVIHVIDRVLIPADMTLSAETPSEETDTTDTESTPEASDEAESTPEATEEAA